MLNGLLNANTRYKSLSFYLQMICLAIEKKKEKENFPFLQKVITVKKVCFMPYSRDGQVKTAKATNSNVHFTTLYESGDV